MHPAIGYEPATAAIPDLRRQARHNALARAGTPVPSSGPEPDRDRSAAGMHRTGWPRRFGTRLWTLLHAQVLLDGPAAAAGSPGLIEDSHRRFAARREAR
jgi:hypothetical protein